MAKQKYRGASIVLAGVLVMALAEFNPKNVMTASGLGLIVIGIALFFIDNVR